MRIFFCLLLGCLASGCAGEDGGVSRFSAVARDRAELFEHVGGEVAVIGTAQSSADRGAVVALEDGTLVGVSELDPWSKRASGRTVTVTGKLARLATPPDASDPTRPATAGREIFLLEGARWRLGDNPPRQVRTR